MRVSPAGRHVTQTAMMQKRLNAAEPTIVDGPSSPVTIQEEGCDVETSISEWNEWLQI